MHKVIVEYSSSAELPADESTVYPLVMDQKFDALALGSVHSRDCKFSSYGRKIESVLSNQVDGSTTEIINKELWNDITCNSI
jgi:hypothetical protein